MLEPLTENRTYLLSRVSRALKTSVFPLLPLFLINTINHSTHPFTHSSPMSTSLATLVTTLTAPSVLPAVLQIASHSFLFLDFTTSVAQVHRSAMTSSAQALTSASVSFLLRRVTASSYTRSAHSGFLAGFITFRRAEKTRNDSEATRGCLSARALRRTGVRIGSAPANDGGEWVEKNKARNDKHVRWRVDVDVVGACDKITCDVDAIDITWTERQPGSTLNNECSSPKPACNVAGAVFVDFS